jgi:hypothetical protein
MKKYQISYLVMDRMITDDVEADGHVIEGINSGNVTISFYKEDHGSIATYMSVSSVKEIEG